MLAGQSETAAPSARAAALLRIARAESAEDLSRAQHTLLEALQAVRMLPNQMREHLLDEARLVAAAVSPELLPEIPMAQRGGHSRFASIQLVKTMLAHGHLDAAFNYVLQHDPASFPFLSVGGVLGELDGQTPENAARRLKLLRRAVKNWRQSPSFSHSHAHDDFVQLFGYFWKDFPFEEASAVARMIVDRAAQQPDTGTSAGYGNEIQFTSPRQNNLFQILHVPRQTDPALAQSLVDSHDQLAAAARRYTNGLATIYEEAEAEAKRRRADGVTCGGGYILAGDPKDFDRQRRLIDATRSGDFETSIEDALEKYREDTSAATPNYAPKQYWPSTSAFRTLFFLAGRHLGPEAITLLERIPDDDIRLFATIELAAGLAGAPESPIRRMRQPRPLTSSSFESGRISSSQATDRDATGGQSMRSPDGRLIRCPACGFQPPVDHRWNCKCGHFWNTFLTSGRCPAYNFQWEQTQCPHCGVMSAHWTWYASEP